MVYPSLCIGGYSHCAITDGFIANHRYFTGGGNEPGITTYRVIVALISRGIDMMQHHSRQKHIAEFHLKPSARGFNIAHFQPAWVNPDGERSQILGGYIMRRHKIAQTFNHRMRAMTASM